MVVWQIIRPESSLSRRRRRKGRVGMMTAVTGKGPQHGKTGELWFLQVSKPERAGVDSKLCHLPAKGRATSDKLLTSLNPSFFICKIQIIIPTMCIDWRLNECLHTLRTWHKVGHDSMAGVTMRRVTTSLDNLIQKQPSASVSPHKYLKRGD